MIRYIAACATARALLANTLLPSLPRTCTHARARAHTHTHAHAHTLSLSVFVLHFCFQELVKQNNSQYVWLTAKFVPSIYAGLNQ